ncbi:MAG: hypothetical protein ACLUD2_03185 [Clostridium sp.]
MEISGHTKTVMPDQGHSGPFQGPRLCHNYSFEKLGLDILGIWPHDIKEERHQKAVRRVR